MSHSPAAPAPGVAPPSAGLQVLYVEDDRITAMLFVEALRQQADVTVRVAETPAEALALVRTWTPHLMVLDAHLPGMSGFALLAQLRALPRLAAVPAYMCSADSDAAIRQRADAAGFQGFWVKPLNPRDLARQMQVFAAARQASPQR